MVAGIMNEQKLLKRKQKAKREGNIKLLAETCNDLAIFYNESGRQHHALREYEEEARLYEKMGSRLENAKSHRMMSEIYIDLDDFDKALRHGDIYLAAARDLNEKIEEQRALATLGRAYLHKGESKQISGESLDAEKALKSAENTFVRSLVICERLKGKTSKYELADMRARLLLNIGIVSEHLNNLDKAVDFLHKAQNICKSEDIFDVLHICYITEGSLYLNKKSDTSAALSCFNRALDVASRLSNKVQKQCETLALKAKVLCKAADYQSAKYVLLKAWKLNKFCTGDKDDIEKSLKFVAAICYTEDMLLTTNQNDHATLRRLYEKMGDGACYFNCYDRAIQFYLKMLEHAEKNGEFGKQLIPCYVSLSQTYKDMGAYEDALDYFRREYALISDNPKEAFHSLLNIAECLYLWKQPFEDIEQPCLSARREAQKLESNKLEVKAIKQLIYYQEAFGFLNKVDSLKNELASLGHDADIETTDEESEVAHENTPSLGDDICIDNITDISDDEEDEDTKGKCRTARKRGKVFTVKKNIKGETQLHQAAISGNRILTERLIAQGHPVNVRDNAGWLPIHEACIHGNKDIVEMLIRKGANVNDRGGTQCDGITPIYDAASNGHLEIVELLLDSGASPIIKTDFGETPLDVLRKWRESAKLTPADQSFFETLCSRIHASLDKSGLIGTSTSPGMSSRSPTKISTAERNNKKSKVSPQVDQTLIGSIDRHRNSIDSLIMDSDEDITPTRFLGRVDNTLCDDSSNNSSDSAANVVLSSKTKKSDGVSEYRNAILALRNRQLSNDEIHLKKSNQEKRQKSALLEPSEVGDDWLEDDLSSQINRKRKRGSGDSTLRQNRKSDESNKSLTINKSLTLNNRPLENIDLLISNSDIANTVRSSGNSSICLFGSDNDSTSSDIPRENIDPSPSILNLDEVLHKLPKNAQKKKIKNKWKYQTTLIKAGFSRRRSSSSVSDLIRENIDLNEMNTVEADSTTEQISESNFRLSGSDNYSDIFQRSYGLGLPHNHTSSNAPPQSNVASAPAAVKVRIMDKLLLIPISVDAINRSQIKWLSEEVARRYYNIEGVKPTLSLLTSDGALLAEEDPLGLVFSSNELLASVTNWNLPPVGDRYIECCQQCTVEVEMDIRNLIDASQATHVLDLSDLSLFPAQVQPIFKAVNHQPTLTWLTLANNSIGMEGVKYLIHCLPTLKMLRSINLSGNCLNGGAVRMLLDMFEKCEKTIMPNLEEINLSYNPIGDVGFKCLLKMTNFVRLKQINIRECDIGDNSLRQEDLHTACLAALESLDIGCNRIGIKTFSLMLSSLNANLISQLNFSGLSIGDKLGEMLSTFIDAGENIKLKHLDLSRCGITDITVSQLLRSLAPAHEFKKLSLQYNSELSVISLKRLVQHSPAIEEIDLEGCSQIFKYCQSSDLQITWFGCGELGRVREIYLTINPTTENEKCAVERFCKMWQCFWDNRASITKFMYGGLKLGVNE